MRMHVDEWLERNERGEFWRVFLDGKEITREHAVFYADEERQLVKVYRRDPLGRVIVVDHRPVIDVLFGEVELRLDGQQQVPKPTRAIRVRE